ncbi:MAG: SpvB/TcaC N-terminal domain-containing protein [Deltaproteobacteria bacterium]
MAPIALSRRSRHVSEQRMSAVDEPDRSSVHSAAPEPNDRARPDKRDARSSPIAPVAPPTLGLPKAGGALHALGEKFQAGGPTGAGAFEIPLGISSCRGVEPTLVLAYASSNGNGAFGPGWAIRVPEITRRTDKGIPRYADAIESDVFILSDQEDLVPVADETPDDGDYRVNTYRPRVEGLFARVERRTHKLTGDAHWRTITSDNVTSTFGWSATARIANPDNPRQIYRWLLDATFDSHGNATRYEYKLEDLANVSRTDPAEASRFARPPTNTYLKRVFYGNRTPLVTRSPSLEDLTATTWLFEVVIDYGEHSTDLPEEVTTWPVRADPVSTFRSGFEIRTYRLCQRILMFHTIPEQLGALARLVRATELGYDTGPAITYLTSARQAGYGWTAQGQVTVAHTPTLRLDYTRVGPLSTSVITVDTASIAQAPAGIDGLAYQFVDLDGEGISGILAPAAGPAPALYYKRNLGGGAFAPAQRLSLQPVQSAFAPSVQLTSLNGDGRLDVASFDGPTPGFYERTRDFSWRPFAAFSSLPNIDWHGRGVHLLDINGDGLTDVLVAEDDVFVWYPSLARAGFGPPHRVTQAHDEDRGAVILTTDDYETIILADMSGDGLADIVRVRNGDISYWPNLGYGRFGAKIAMSGAPLFDTPDLFDPRRVRVGDVDGTGTSDLVYLSARGAVVYLNQAGNSWSLGTNIPLPVADQFASIRLVDLLGTGTACLVWSSSNPADAGMPLRYVDLLRSSKPHLLCAVENGLGARTAITYAPSTRFYLEDRAAGRMWATRLPFVLQVVERVQLDDAVAGTSCVLRYRYAHGFYDGVEREFRGFARVDTWDAESVSFGAHALPPVHTISWFHTGAWNGERADLRTALALEFYSGDAAATALAPDLVPSTLLPPAQREATRAFKGRLLRQEIYGEDGTLSAAHPYSVTEQRYEVRELQSLGDDRHGVYHAFMRESLSYNYERDPRDPRIAHRLELEIDFLGHVTRGATLAYARRTPAEPEQARVLATCSASTYAPSLATTYDYRHGVLVEQITYELDIPPTSHPLALTAVDAAMTTAMPVAFDVPLAAGSMRTLERVRHQFWADDLAAALPQGSVGTRGLPYDSLALALPITLLESAFGGRLTAADATAAGYVSLDGAFWIHSGVTGYDASAFYHATSYTDPFGNTASVVFDAPMLFVVETHSSKLAALDNVTTAAFDYRVLAPVLITDPNGNRSAAAYDELGMVVAIAAMGRDGASEGDTLADPTQKVEYDLLTWQSATPSPAYVHVFARRVHGAANPGWLETYSYSDGSGHEVLAKIQAEPGGDDNPRWIGSGRTVFDNKHNPVKTYEPYFAAGPDYDAETAIATSSHFALHTYDPLSRQIRVDLADGTFVTTTRSAWLQIDADANDTVLASAWYADASTRPTTDPLYRAAQLAAAHANTPTVQAFDPLARGFLVTLDNGPLGMSSTRTALDAQGNAVAVTDAVGNVVVSRTFDALGRALVTEGSDTGTVLTFVDAVSVRYRDWDARGFAHRTVYDSVHRPTQLWATIPGQAELLVELITYGEGVAMPNFRGHIYLRFDGSGVVQITAYNFEGHVTGTSRQLALAYTTTPSWSTLAAITDPTMVLPAAGGLLEIESFTTELAYNALGHVVRSATPDGSITTSSYDAGGRLASVACSIRGATTPTPIVAGIVYNAAGQRIAVTSGTAVTATYTYDPRNRRVLRLRSTRSSNSAALQDLQYTHDATGNIVEIDDAAQETVYFAGNVTTGSQRFAYDATYRLVHAEGREHPGQVGYASGSDNYPEAPVSTLPHPNDLQTLVAYTEDYTYDAVGNLLATVHAAGGNNWTRTQTIVAGSNRIATVSLPGDPAAGPYSGVFTHDASGNLASMPNLSAMQWDHAGRFVEVSLGGGGTAYFTYDSEGQRVRKVVARGGKLLVRLYIGTYERYRELNAATSAVNLERDTLNVGDGRHRFALIETKTADTSVTGLVPSPQLRFQLVNHVESVGVEVDANGAILTYEEYYPYGGTSFRAGDDDKRYRFIGKERDEETGLYYVGARYYAPWLARWTSPDPKRPASATSVYVYANDNPIAFVDPSGNEPENYYSYPRTPGDQWWGYFLGTAAHVLIGLDYEAHFPDEVVFTNDVTVGKILDDNNIGDSSRLTKTEAARRPDITDISPGTRFVYEIKPGLNRPDQADWQARAQTQLGGYLHALYKGLDTDEETFRPGVPFEGRMYVQFPMDKTTTVWRLSWKTTKPGVIQYRWERFAGKKMPESIREAIGLADWIEVPLAEQQANATAVFNAVADELALSHTLSQIEAWSQVLNIVGAAVVNAGLEQMTAEPAAVPKAPAAAVPAAPAAPPNNVIPLRPTAPAAPAPPPAVPMRKAA